MTTIATQTNNEVTELFRFRDVAEEYNTSHAVNDELMSKIEAGLETIKKLEETLAEKNKIIKEYQSVEKDYADGVGAESLREAIEGMARDRQNEEDDAEEWRQLERERGFYDADEVGVYLDKQEELDEKVEDMEDEIEGLKKEIGRYDKSRDAWMETANERYGEITKLKKEIDEFEEDFKPLHEYMSGMTGVCNCKDVVDYIERLKKEIKELKEIKTKMLCQ